MGPVYKVQGRQMGGERYSLLLLVMVLLLLLVVVVVDVVVVVILQKTEIVKHGCGTSHQTCGCCLKTTQLGQVTLSMWKRQIGKGSAY